VHSLNVLCESNVLSLISQWLDNYYQIQMKYYIGLQYFWPRQILAPKRGPGRNDSTLQHWWPDPINLGKLKGVITYLKPKIAFRRRE
jgi:hypothetical protein